MSFPLILTHTGGSHKDEFLTCCVLLAHGPALSCGAKAKRILFAMGMTLVNRGFDPNMNRT